MLSLGLQKVVENNNTLTLYAIVVTKRPNSLLSGTITVLVCRLKVNSKVNSLYLCLRNGASIRYFS